MPSESTRLDWDLLIAEFPALVQTEVELHILTPKEAERLINDFVHLAADQRRRAVLRERWRHADALAATGKITLDEVAALRRQLLHHARAIGLGDPPW